MTSELTDGQILSLRSADRALQDATFRLAMAVDFAASVLPAWHLPTDVLHALDDYREAAALMWPFMTPEPIITEIMKDGLCVVCGTLTSQYRETRDGVDWCHTEHALEPPAGPTQGWIDPHCSISGCDKPVQFTDGAKSYCWNHHPSYAVPAGPTQDQGSYWEQPHDEQATQDQEAIESAVRWNHPDDLSKLDDLDKLIERHKGCGEECPVKRVVASLREQQATQAEPKRCTALGCETPAFCKVGEFWYCDEHASDPIPF